MREGIDCKGRKWIERELKKNEKDLSGQTYESLTVLFPIHSDKYDGWLCQCACKNQYAFDHNIPLVRIPYKERDNITLDLLLGDKYLLYSPS